MEAAANVCAGFAIVGFVLAMAAWMVGPLGVDELLSVAICALLSWFALTLVRVAGRRE